MKLSTSTIILASLLQGSMGSHIPKAAVKTQEDQIVQHISLSFDNFDSCIQLLSLTFDVSLVEKAS